MFASDAGHTLVHGFPVDQVEDMRIPVFGCHDAIAKIEGVFCVGMAHGDACTVVLLLDGEMRASGWENGLCGDSWAV